MGERKSLAASLGTRLVKSVSKVNPRAKKSFRTLAKAHGVSKKRIKAALKKKKAALRPAVVQAAAAEPETPAAFSGGDLVRLAQKLSGLAGQLRLTGGRRLRRK